MITPATQDQVADALSEQRLSRRFKKVDRPSETFSPHVIEKRVRRNSRRRLLSFSTLGWSISDSLIAFAAVVLGYLLSPVAFQAATSETSVKLLPCAITFALILVPAAHIAGLHDPRRRSDLTGLVVRCFITTAIAMSALTLAWMLFSFLRIGRYVVVLSTLAAMSAMVVTRLASWNWSSKFKQKVCFTGSVDFLNRVSGFLAVHPISISVSGQPDPDVNLGSWAAGSDVDEVVFESSRAMVDDLGLLDCLDAGVKVTAYSDFIEEKYQRVPVEDIDANWLLSARLDLAHPYYHGIKRVIDIWISVVGLVLSAPLIALSALAIRLEGPGDVFYSQIRVGRFNRPFRIYKLRTMKTDSENGKAQWAKKNDSRITMVGKVLRKTRLDELPQFWNVLRGEMSLIGPRPERPEFVDDLGEQIPFYHQRHLVKPGLTGWAQINYPYGASVEDAYNKLTFDFFYIKNASVGLDLQIFLRTIGTVMKGAR